VEARNGSGEEGKSAEADALLSSCERASLGTPGRRLSTVYALRFQKIAT
jgi:hypothetical protein